VGQSLTPELSAAPNVHSAGNEYASLSDVDVDVDVDVEGVGVGVGFEVADNDGAGVLGQDLRQREFQIIIDMLRKENGRKKQTAEKLGISPRTLRYKMARMRDCGIDLDAELSAA